MWFLVLLRHTLTTCPLYSVLPSERCAPNERILRTFLAELTVDLLELERSGSELIRKQR